MLLHNYISIDPLVLVLGHTNIEYVGNVYFHINDGTTYYCSRIILMKRKLFHLLCFDFY